MKTHRLQGPFQYVAGVCWAASVGELGFPLSDDEADPSGSCLILSEDDADLGPPHTAHQIIAADGGGRYSHWKGVVYFSASDGSDPNDNAKAYSVRWDLDAYFTRKSHHALNIVESYAQRLPDGLRSFAGERVLEIGPGRDMGTLFILAGLGAEQALGVDRFAGDWQDGWHDRFLDRLAVVARERLGIDLTALAQQAKVARRPAVGPIAFSKSAFETMGGEWAGAFGLSVSHSVFEHFYSVEEAAQALYAVTVPGGRGVHNVDFRDHKNFGEPLEFLLVDDADYAKSEVNSDYGRGNRVRPARMAHLLSSAGFSSVDFHPTETASEAYLDGFAARLKDCFSSFRNFGREDFSILAGAYMLAKE